LAPAPKASSDAIGFGRRLSAGKAESLKPKAK
jgi:hypothetical protein